MTAPVHKLIPRGSPQEILSDLESRDGLYNLVVAFETDGGWLCSWSEMPIAELSMAIRLLQIRSDREIQEQA